MPLTCLLGHEDSLTGSDSLKHLTCDHNLMEAFKEGFPNCKTKKICKMLISREAFVAVLTFMDSKTGQEAEAWRVTFQLERVVPRAASDRV